jgi:ankyrin repeat protein
MCIDELVRWGADINAQESWGQTPLIIATLKGRVHCMKALIQTGATTEQKDYHHGNTALHCACNSKDEELVLTLCDASADVMATNKEGQSPLGVALSNKIYRLVPLLLEYGARLNDRDRQHLPQMLQSYIDDITGNDGYFVPTFEHCELREGDCCFPNHTTKKCDLTGLPPQDHAPSWYL